MLLAGVGIVGLAGLVMYGSLRGLGVIQHFPDLLRNPNLSRGTVTALRSGMERLRERARKVGQPMDPSDLPKRSDGTPEPPPRQSAPR